MAARAVPLVGDRLDELPPRCRSCVFWELGAPQPAEDLADAAGVAADDRVRKQAWVTSQSLESGAPGVLLRQDGRTVAYALFAPGRAFAPRSASVPAISEDALLLATAWVEPSVRSGGLGRLLVQAAVRETLHLDLRAVEAYGDRRSREWDCVAPVSWLLHEGFEVRTEHPRYPLLRLDVRRVARWADSLESAVEELLGRARGAPRMRPAPDPLPSTTGQGRATSVRSGLD